MKKTFVVVLFVLFIGTAGVSFAGDWNIAKNVKRLDRVSPEYKDDKEIDKKFLEVLDLTEKTRKDTALYDEAKRIAGMSSVSQSKYMDSFLYYMYVKSLSLSKSGTAEPDYWLGLLKVYDKSPHLLAAYLIRLRLVPKNSPDLRQYAQIAVDWVKAQKPVMKVRPPEYTGNILLGRKPRADFAEGDPLKLYTLSYYKESVTPLEGFLEDDTYISLLNRIKEGREDVMTEMVPIYRKAGKRNEASDVLYQLAMLKALVKDYKAAKTLLDDAVRLNKDNVAAVKERDRIKLELTYESLSPAVPAEPTPPAEPAATPEPAPPVQPEEVPPSPTVAQ